MPVQTVRPRRLYQQIAEQLLRLIRQGEFVVGERLPGELSLAQQLGVSRPSVREALIILEAAGQIEIQNGAGSFVRPDAPTFRSFPWWRGDSGPGPLEQFRARYVLEPELAAEAARFITDEEIDELQYHYEQIDIRIARKPEVNSDHMTFHEKVALASRNVYLAEVVRELLAFSRTGEVWKSVRARIDTAENLRDGQEERKQLIAALRRRDSRGSRAAMKRHFRRIGRLCFGEDFEKGGAASAKRPESYPVVAGRESAANG